MQSDPCVNCQNAEQENDSAYCLACLDKINEESQQVCWVRLDVLFETSGNAEDVRTRLMHSETDDGLLDWLMDGLGQHIRLIGTFDLNVPEVTNEDRNPIVAVHVCS